MINSTFALGTYELNLQTDAERAYIFDNMSSVCSYIDTAINYNNDYIFNHKAVSNMKFISKLASCHNDVYDFFVDNHLKWLNRDYIDIMLIHSSRGDWRPIAIKMDNDSRFREVGVSNFNITDLVAYKELLGHYPAYNEIEINPQYTDFETITFCKNNGIKIIAYGIFGGKYRAVRNIATYSLPYLISYASQLADIVIIRPDSLRHVDESIDVINNFVIDSIEFDLKNKTDKAIEPMVYNASKLIRKYYNNNYTYHIACGKNLSDKKLVTQTLDDILPSFEMLGDYATYLRYKYRTIITDNPYDYDFLIGDDNNYYVAYLYDIDGNLSKINETDNVQLYRLIRR